MYVGGDHLLLFLVKATMTPALPENFKLTELLKTDMQIESEITPR